VEAPLLVQARGRLTNQLRHVEHCVGYARGLNPLPCSRGAFRQLVSTHVLCYTYARFGGGDTAWPVEQRQ
jgi:hypothetical protein